MGRGRQSTDDETVRGDPAARETEAAGADLVAVKAAAPDLGELVAADALGGYQVVASYPDGIIANLARAKLMSVGIRARLRDEETVAIDPLLGGAVGGVKVVTLAADAADARAILEALEAEDDPHEADALEPRCPDCDSPYLRTVRGKVRCQRCGFSGKADDVARRRAPYRAAPGRHGDPVFRLVRRSTGLGVFVGLLFSSLFMMIAGGKISGVGVFVYPIGVFAACVVIGRSLRVDLCSRPKCRTRLANGVTVCPACHGHVEGEIHRAGEHHARRAAWLKGDALLPRR